MGIRGGGRLRGEGRVDCEGKGGRGVRGCGGGKRGWGWGGEGG